jgi:maleate cis-trans isomerase
LSFTPLDQVKSALHSAIEKTRKNPDAVILFAGTGVLTLSEIDSLPDVTNTPVVTSQLAGIWNLFCEAGFADEIDLSPSLSLRRLNKHVIAGY